MSSNTLGQAFKAIQSDLETVLEASRARDRALQAKRDEMLQKKGGHKAWREAQAQEAKAKAEASSGPKPEVLKPTPAPQKKALHMNASVASGDLGKALLGALKHQPLEVVSTQPEASVEKPKAKPQAKKTPTRDASRQGDSVSRQGRADKTTKKHKKFTSPVSKDPQNAPRTLRVERKTTGTPEARTHRAPKFEDIQTPIPPFTLMAGLPVTQAAPTLIEAIQKHRVIIVCGETGSGKTTQLPKIALMAGRGKTGRIAHTQPRRLAASSVARRIADEMKTELGTVVGYQVRFTDESDPGTTIKLMTDGILLNQLEHDRLLKAYDTIILDEAHERSLNIDFLLGALKQLLAKRDDLKVIVTSATMDAKRLSEHFTFDGQPAPVFKVEGRTYPVEILYQPIEDLDDWDDEPLHEGIRQAIDTCIKKGSGDILVFLPGEREIHETFKALNGVYQDRLDFIKLFARLSQEEQDRVFKTGMRRRVILSTNVAETSLTVPGIRYVIDTGYARVKRYSYRSKVEQLQIEPISQAAANQRAGRCGRVRDGVCIRLYSELDFTARAPYTDPEILRSNLAQVILKALSARLGDVREFPFVSRPPERAFADGFSLLEELGAIDGAGRLTALGRDMAKLPVDPRLARILLAGAQKGALRECLVLASAMSIQDPRERPLEAQEAADRAHQMFLDEKSDFMSYLKLWDWAQALFAGQGSHRQKTELCHERFLSVRRLREWQDLYQQLKALTDQMGWPLSSIPASYEAIHQSLLTGLLGHIGSRAVQSDLKAPPYLGARGVKFWVWPGSARAKRGGRWLMAASLVDTTRLYARTCALIEPEWIEWAAGDRLKKHWASPHWEKVRGEVMALERATLYGLTVYQDRSVSLKPRDPMLARTLMIQEGLVPGQVPEMLPFLTKNLAMVKKVEEMEHQSRRPDVLVDDALQEAFYDERLPQDVASWADLKHYVKKHPEVNDPDSPLSLVMTQAQLMRHDAKDIHAKYYPKVWRSGNVEMPLSYHFEPGSLRDGITIEVPLMALNQLDETPWDWLVLGYLKPKVTALIKTLPQSLRRACVPVEKTVSDFFDEVERHPTPEQSVTTRLASFLTERLKRPVHPQDFKREQLDAHHTMNIALMSEDGVMLDMSRSLAHLKREYGQQAQALFKQVAKDEVQDRLEPVLMQEGLLTSWTLEEWPELMEIERDGVSLIGHPALVDKGEGCVLEVFDEASEAARHHERGLLRLLKISLKEQLKFIRKRLGEAHRTWLEVSTIAGLGQSMTDREALLDDLIDRVLMDVALMEPWPDTPETFAARRDEAKARLGLMTDSLMSLMERMIRLAYQVTLAMKRAPEYMQQSFKATLERLFPKHFLRTTPMRQLESYPRYLEAMLYRLEKFDKAPERDEANEQAWQQLWRQYERARAQWRGQAHPQLDEFRWLMEELRVGLFAQALKTPMPVSIKRLERIWQTLQIYQH